MSISTRIVVKAETLDKLNRYYMLMDIHAFLDECAKAGIPTDATVRLSGPLEIEYDRERQ